MKHLFHLPPCFSLQGTLPNRQYTPAHTLELGTITGIALCILLKLFPPELPAIPRPFEKVAVVTMPEAPVDLYHCTVLWVDQIRPARQQLALPPIRIPQSVPEP